MKNVKLNPSDLFRSLDVKNEEEALKVFEATLNFLLYIDVGEEIRLPSTTFRKISHDKIAISQSVTDRDNMLKLHKKRIIEIDV